MADECLELRICLESGFEAVGYPTPDVSGGTYVRFDLAYWITKSDGPSPRSIPLEVFQGAQGLDPSTSGFESLTLRWL